MNKWLACTLVALTSGCPDIKTDPDETSAAPIVEFDPSRSVVPFPNNLLINQMTGEVTVPAGCNESASTKGLRETVLNQLDGFGTFETAMSVTLTKPIDPASITADNVLLFKAAADPSTSNAIPVVVFPGSSIRFANQTRQDDGSLVCDTPNPIDSMTIVPRIPLDQKSTYFVALKSGLKTAEGEDYIASFTWSLVRQPENPVVVDDQGNIVSDRTPLDPSTPAGLASLQGINLLWNAHAPVLAFLGAKGVDRNDVLLAWSFKTQTVQDALDRTVAGTPAAALNLTDKLTGPLTSVPIPISIPGQLITANLPASRQNPPFGVCTTGAGTALPENSDVQCFLKMALGGGTSCTTALTCGEAFVRGTGACSLLGCSNIGDLLAARVSAAQYQVDRPNAFDPAKPIPGPWGDPVKPTKVRDDLVHVLITIPAQAPPTEGWPVAIFQHGLGRGRTDLLAIGGHLAKVPPVGAPFATVAIDAVAHGDGLGPFPGRAVRNSNDAAKGCGGTPTAGTAPQCFAGFLSPDLGATRDNIRQTNLDHQQLVAAVKACGPTAAGCGALKVNAASMVYIGQSLGGILGGTTLATTPDLKAGVLNVPAVGWADVFENTETLAIRCTLVDGLIDAGTLVGEKFNPTAMTGLCTTDAWKTQPGYRQFAAIGRWVLDPGDPANFVSRLVMAAGAKKFLIQMVVGDKVVPNLATQNEAALTGRTASPAPVNTSQAPGATPAILAPMPASKFITYTTAPPNLAAGFPGNTYAHGSLLSPAPSANATSTMDVCTPTTPQFCDGVLALAQMVVDAVTYLHINK